MAFIDIDEFIFVKTGQTLIEFLDEHFSRAVNVGGLTINWRTFGSSGHLKYNPEPVVERFTHRAPDDFERNHNVKTILNPRHTLLSHGAHFFEYRMGCCSTDENLLETKGNLNPRNPASRIQINHYVTKSWEECWAKYNRGRADTVIFYADKQFKYDDRNEIEDTSLRDFRRELIKLPRRKSQYGREIQLQNLIEMLKNPSNQFQGELEKFLTCFHLSQTIENLSSEDREFLARLSLQSILKSLSLPKIKQHDAILFMEELPRILISRLPEASEIFERSRFLADSLIDSSVLHSGDIVTYERVLQMKINAEIIWNGSR